MCNPRHVVLVKWWACGVMNDAFLLAVTKKKEDFFFLSESSCAAFLDVNNWQGLQQAL